MPTSAYSAAARKTKAAMQKQYGSATGTRVFYALANKRTGGFKGKNRGAKAANAAFAKGKKFGGRSRGGKKR